MQTIGHKSSVERVYVEPTLRKRDSSPGSNDSIFLIFLRPPPSVFLGSHGKQHDFGRWECVFEPRE
ncbi:hypothetical protein ATCV1_z735L [Acanthocystis turfacea chlorella virus 1]|uniref:Uncharacterized protein z735L n=1 Tax=Chlorovirus heliozoae TaxID=322019 RepID=A7K9Z5_9PHYC|nr:hypothetical protein ATCV1_z735L [Acanthocystis turfacea chlorella virus 1]ABT16869.1 hypothetical protein ATCV1_z735L [Acanthocystis turfacea chlorella virus 1]